MKSIRQKKQILNHATLEQEFFEDALLYGIVSALPSYRLIWQIKQVFHYDFRREHEFEIEYNGVFFEVYTFIEKLKLVEHYIYTNRKGTSFLMDDARHIDFIWMIKGVCRTPEYMELLPAYLKEINGIDHSFLIDPMQLKSRQHLIL